MKPCNTIPARYARPKEVCAHLRISASTLWEWSKNRPSFPRPIKAGPRVTLFDITAIEHFIRDNA